MAKEVKIAIEFTQDNVLGVADGLSDRQVTNLNIGSNSVRLNKDLVYYIPKQKIHLEKWSDDTAANPALKVFAIGINADGEATCVTSLSVNTLRARYLCEANEPQHFETTVNADGLVRFAPQPVQYSVWADEFRIPVKAENKQGLFTEPVFFKVSDRHNVLVPAFVKDAKIKVNGRDGYHIRTYKDSNIAALDNTVVWLYTKVEGTEVDTSCIPGFEKYAL